MIEKLKLTNYRGFDNHTIPFSELNIIVGSNNAGKSTIVQSSPNFIPVYKQIPRS